MIVLSFPLWCAPLFMLAFGLQLYWVAAGAFIAGVGNALFNVAWSTAMQQTLSSANYGQIVSWLSLGPQIVAPLGLLVAGSLQAAPAQQSALLVGAFLGIAGSVALALTPVMRKSPDQT
ncbi:hypothetical protein NS359_08090 [Curtobacterium oceanosedimentum]|uniref:Major facilitator superfamily (MFS) profile domain-containing protein n=1 Tax=Curtobacterium oceanosedimentum TaxID=465820 RepID=A0A147DR01_9MICO|nr:hypothetical protein NS359_08090 [Curtobacterium oceanosedimentum]